MRERTPPPRGARQPCRPGSAGRRTVSRIRSPCPGRPPHRRARPRRPRRRAPSQVVQRRLARPTVPLLWEDTNGRRGRASLDRSLIVQHLARQHSKQRCLAHTVGPDHRKAGLRCNGQVDPVEDGSFGGADRDALENDRRHEASLVTWTGQAERPLPAHRTESREGLAGTSPMVSASLSPRPATAPSLVGRHLSRLCPNRAPSANQVSTAGGRVVIAMYAGDPPVVLCRA